MTFTIGEDFIYIIVAGIAPAVVAMTAAIFRSRIGKLATLGNRFYAWVVIIALVTTWIVQALLGREFGVGAYIFITAIIFIMTLALLADSNKASKG